MARPVFLRTWFLVASRRRDGGDLYLYSLRNPVEQVLDKGGYLGEIGRDHLFRGKREAFRGVFDRLDRSICATCTARIFEECRTLPAPDGPPKSGG